MIEIDGSSGEGGGQILRTSLTLSIITGLPVEISGIRMRRKEHGLKAQHLAALRAAAQICQAEVSGGSLGSTRVAFKPGQVRSGRYTFEVGTAGSTLLVLQTVFLPLSLASSASTVAISGGTHVNWSPCYHTIELHWLEILRQSGFDAALRLDKAGFYPQGNGRITATIRPAGEIAPFTLPGRGPLASITGVAGVANLDREIASRMKRQTRLRLAGLPVEPRLSSAELPSAGKGAFIVLRAQFSPASVGENPAAACYFGLGALGKPSEQVADEAVEQLEAFLATPAAVDEYLADQLLIPALLCRGQSLLHTCRVTDHLLTNAALINQFLPGAVTVAGEADAPGLVNIQGRREAFTRYPAAEILK